ncbi:hypothetical protein chiPu_0007749 [Chiloscyllium punctatum]|uniref:BZIP domain-containing protein n=1 Tax=Chiloscyllium punctatum TaxID=137246 RepID=A0A401SG42_CHIPU|nr:hypothetical protein [Chiloscyllium punctatum]
MSYSNGRVDYRRLLSQPEADVRAAEVSSPYIDMRPPGVPRGDPVQSEWGFRFQRRALSPAPRRKREFVPEEKKDVNYWSKRERNNNAAKKSRERRRLHDMQLEMRILALMGENKRLKTELLTLKCQLGLTGIPLHSQALRRGLLSSLLPDLRALKCAATLDPYRHAAPPFGLDYRQAAEPTLASSQLAPRPPREDALHLTSVLRRPFSEDGAMYCEGRLRCVKCNVESSACSHLSKPQGCQQLVRGSDSGSTAPLNPSGTQTTLPHKLRFKTNQGGEHACLHPRQDCLSSSSCKGGLVEIYIDPQKGCLAPREAFRDRTDLNLSVHRR